MGAARRSLITALNHMETRATLVTGLPASINVIAELYYCIYIYIDISSII